jgi:multidrug efflux system outer membrane protein
MRTFMVLLSSLSLSACAVRAPYEAPQPEPFTATAAVVDRRTQTIPGFSEGPVDISSYQAGFDAYWELDLFGRVRSAVTAAAATADGLDLSLDAVRVRIVADVARNYFELRGLQQRLAVVERSLANVRDTLRLTTVRHEGGIGEAQDVASARARVAAVEAAIPPLRAQIVARTHRLAVLAGERPGSLAQPLDPRPYPALRTRLALGEAGDLLQRRPDVRAAERRLAAAAAREGVAAADLYPRVTLSGFLGLLAGRGTTFGSADSRAWAVTPALSWAAFDLGSARARLRGAEAASAEALAEFEQVVLLALEEAQNSLVAYQEQQRRLVQLAEQARDAARAADIARLRYREGVSDFLALLDAERTQLDAESGVAEAEAEVFTRVVAVYKAFGGVTVR